MSDHPCWNCFHYRSGYELGDDVGTIIPRPVCVISETQALILNKDISTFIMKMGCTKKVKRE